MADSNSGWGDVAEAGGELAETFDSYARLPEPGEHDLLDALVAAKNIDHGALVRLGARLADHHVIAFAGKGYIKYRNLIDGDRWTYLGSTYPQVKLVQAHAKPSDTVIIVEGETDAARVMRLYPEADIASMPCGAKYFPTAYADQLRDYARVVVGLDPDQAGEEGAAKIMALLPHAVRVTPGNGDWCELEGTPPALPAVVELDRVGNITFESLEGDFEDPEIIVDDLLYSEGLHVFDGIPGHGKTTLVMHIAKLCMQEGRHVVWLDYEGGRRATRRRLDHIGVGATLRQEWLHYASFPVDAANHIAAIGHKYPNALVVIDSMSKALAYAGLDENSNTDVTTWAVPVVKACKDLNLPVVIIDHIGKKAGDSPYARGAGAKLADVDVQWRVSREEEFNRDTIGLLKVKQSKDREGFFPFETWWKIGDGKGGLPIEATDGPPGDDPNNPETPPI